MPSTSPPVWRTVSRSWSRPRVPPQEGHRRRARSSASARATAEQLDGVDGIGPTLAERIVEHRGQKGGFGSLDDLRDVEGIGEKRLEALREALQP